MTFKRNAIKNNFKTGDKPTEVQFAEFIDSGFNLHKYQYDSDYAYEEGNIVMQIVGGKWAAYRRNDYEPNAIGKLPTETTYWKKILQGINIFNDPTIIEDEDPIGAPFDIFDKTTLAKIANSNTATESAYEFDVGDIILFEERVYNAPGKYNYEWVVKNRIDDTVHVIKNTRDLSYEAEIPGQYTVTLTVYEYGVTDPIIKEWDFDVAGEGAYQPVTITNFNISPESATTTPSSIVFSAQVNKVTDIEVRLYETDPSGTPVDKQLSVIKDAMIGTNNYVLVDVNTFNGVATKLIQDIVIGEDKWFKMEAHHNDGVNSSNDTSDVETLVYDDPVESISFLLFPKKYYTYSGGSYPLSLNIQALFTPSPNVPADYIKVINSEDVSIHTFNNPTIVDGEFDDDTVDINSFGTAKPYNLRLSYKDIYMVTPITSNIEQIVIQEPIQITASIEGTTYNVKVNTNKVPLQFDDNTYVVKESIDGSNWVTISGWTSDAVGGLSRINFVSSFDGTLTTGDAYHVKVTENIGEDGRNETSESEFETSYNEDPPPLYGVITEIELNDIDFSFLTGYQFIKSQFQWLGSLGETLKINNKNVVSHVPPGTVVELKIGGSSINRTVESSTLFDDQHTQMTFTEELSNHNDVDQILISSVYSYCESMEESDILPILTDTYMKTHQMDSAFIENDFILNFQNIFDESLSIIGETLETDKAYQWIAFPSSATQYTEWAATASIDIKKAIATTYFVFTHDVDGVSYRVYVYSGKDEISGDYFGQGALAVNKKYFI